MKALKMFAASLMTLMTVSSAFAATDMKVNGSTTVLPVMQKAAESYMAVNTDVNIAISGGGSGNGIKALLDGLCNIAMASRDIKASEIELAKSKGIDPVRTSIAIDALIPVVHPNNPVQNLSMEQLKDIYAGKIRNWKDVGGADKPIVIISRDTSSGTFEVWSEKVMNKSRVAPNALLQASNGTVVQSVSKNKNAIGYIGIGYLNDTLKALDVNGIEANADTAMSGEWVIARDLYVFTNGAGDKDVQAFIAYILDPRKGQKAVQEIGFVPLAK